MPFTGKCTFTAGTTLPELAQDVSDLVEMVSPVTTPLLDLLGDPLLPATSTHHEWLEDALVGNTGTISDSAFVNATTDATFGVGSAGLFHVGDVIQVDGSLEIMLITVVDNENDQITVVRGYGGSTAEALVDGKAIKILSNAALEGADLDAAQNTNRTRKENYTQIITKGVSLSGTMEAVQSLGVDSEYQYQQFNRVREALRDLEAAVVWGRAPATVAQGSATVRRTMNGIAAYINSGNIFTAGSTTGFAAGGLSIAHIRTVQRKVYELTGTIPSVAAVSPTQAAALSTTVSPRYWIDQDQLRDRVVSVLTEFGPMAIVPVRCMNAAMAMFISPTLIQVKPLRGRSFHHKSLAVAGDSLKGQIIGEYTCEVRNGYAHALLKGLTV